MQNIRQNKIVSLILTALFCIYAALPIFSSVDEAGTLTQSEGIDREVFDTHGIEPILPMAGDIDVSRVDFYYEVKNDSLPGLHGGIDMICPEGTEIFAVYSGVVCDKGSSSGTYGYNITVEHTLDNGEKFYSRYAHLSEYIASVGDEVAQGEVIALSGNTGQSYTPHLHLEIYTAKTPTRYERSYTTKYLLSLGVEELSRMSFYEHVISGEYNSQPRVYRLGSGGSCYSRCGLDSAHTHISKYAEYVKAFYSLSGFHYYYDEDAEGALFADEVLRTYVYKNHDTDGDGHLSYYEVMSVTELDLRGLEISSLDGTELFSNLQSILTDTELPVPVHTLTVNYRIPAGCTTDAGLLGLWKHVDIESGLNMRSGPSTSYSRVGSIAPLAVFRVTDTARANGYTWGKTVYGGVEGWCVIGNDWTEQLTSGRGKYTVDSDGYLIYTDTAERVESRLSSSMTASELFDGTVLDFLCEGRSFGGWTRNGYDIAYGKTQLTELCPELLSGDLTLTLDAYIGYCGIAGDVDASGVIDEADLNLLLRYLSGYRGEGLSPDLFDINEDGKVNNRDLIAIKQTISE